MKFNIIRHLSKFLTGQAQIVQQLAMVLNRNLDTADAHMLHTELSKQIDDHVLRVVQGKTSRIRHLLDVWTLSGLAHSFPSTRLNYVSTEPEEGVEPRTRIKLLELLQVLFLSDVLPESLLSHFSLDPKKKSFGLGGLMHFSVSSTSSVMRKLGEEHYIELHLAISTHSGNINLEQFTCASEEMDFSSSTQELERMGVHLDTQAIFFEHFFSKLSSYIIEDHVMMEYHSVFKALEREEENAKDHYFTIYTGTPDAEGKYHTRQYRMYDYPTTSNQVGGWSLYEGGRGPVFDRSLSVQVPEEKIIPYMVASQLPAFAGQTKFLVQYDTEEQNIVMIPGDPYVASDPLAEVLL